MDTDNTAVSPCYDEIFQRSRELLGDKVQQALRDTRVIVFGVGGVGSWCAEGLVRSGIGKLAIVDFDSVSVSNINRQRMADTRTLGLPKVDALADMLLAINPALKLERICRRVSGDNLEEFRLDSYDYVVDAIDSLKDKAALIRAASASAACFFSSMGAARKLDPTRIHVTNFWKVRDCPLGAALRKKLRREGNMPERSFLCVYGDEVMDCEKGSLVHITSIFGMTLAGLVIKDIYAKNL